MSAVALLATVVQRIRIGYFPIRIEITYPRSDNLSAYSHHGRRYVGGMQWLSSGLRADDLKPGTGPGVARDLRLNESCAAPLGARTAKIFAQRGAIRVSSAKKFAQRAKKASFWPVFRVLGEDFRV